jgi:hypothetical protein
MVSGSFSRCFALAFCCVCLVFAQPASTPALAIRDVTIIDGTGTPARPGMTVVVENRRISSIGPSSVSLSRAIHVVERRGKYLIPGLWDAHVHALWDANRPGQFFPLFLANGVTSVREMGGPMPAAEQAVWRQRVADGEVIGPDLVVPGPFVDGPQPVWPGAITVANAPQARKAHSLCRSRSVVH